MLIIPLLVLLQGGIADSIQLSRSEVEDKYWVVIYCFMIVSYITSLRNPEEFILDLEGCHLIWRKKDGNGVKKDCVNIFLRGKVKR